MLDELKRARETKDEAYAIKKRIIEKAQTSAEYITAQSQQDAAELAAADVEKEVKALAVQMNELAAELPERVKVKMFTVVTEYDKAKAREWCFANFRPALMLDEKTFEKAVKDGNIPAELATVIKEARAQIATKL